ncbi:hypothetical protein [Hydrogenimonas cancrithermarum]|uniref:Uncharacterized protein n=1 Tax=Hydrogenimonas cancrithermarum TaxID=2993563 RepID=A0ABM8FMH3_9BACT|nr:hypothetical protein [Hydrogenimonas cancrithermarum]BDY13583.1 hypothetical protein HCR_18950 [Hydrogenimonas cancrithermarum]
MNKRILKLLLVAFAVMATMAGCGEGGDEAVVSTVPSTPIVSRSTPLEMIGDESFNALSEEDKIYVANKLYTTFYKGVDLETLKGKIASGHFISDFYATLHSDDVAQPDLDKIKKDEYEIADGKRFGGPLTEKFRSIYTEIATTLYYTKLSKSYYDAWMAYILDQTILFSPGWEIESVHPFPELISSNYNRLKDGISKDMPIKKIAYAHMVSKENWARFRSSEDNGREMLEIWLYDFNDLDVPLAAKALKNWRWEVRYEPVSDMARDYAYYHFNDTTNADEKNAEPIELLGTTITTGEDFYHAIVNHEDFMHGVVLRLVNIFFPDYTEEKKVKIVNAIIETNPTTFRDIFEEILFSKEYLFNSNRVKSYEEIYMGLAHKLDINPGYEIFGFFHQTGRQVYEGGLVVSKQEAFTYKLGRSDRVPSDSDSVMRLHLNIRDEVFLNRRGSRGWNYSNLLSRYYNDDTTLKGYLNNMFLDIVGRNMTEMEEKKLIEVATNAGCVSATGFDKFPIMLMAFDYFSRLSEVYVYRKVEVEGDAS